MKNLKASAFILFFGVLTFLLIIPLRLLLQASNYSQELCISSFFSEMKGANVIVNAMVNDEEGNPLPGVSVTFRDINGRQYAVPGDASGRFRINIDRSLLPRQIRLKVELQGFTTREFSYDLPIPPTEPPENCKPSIACPTKEKALKDGEGINFEKNEIVQKDQSYEYDIYFQGEFFYAKSGAGEIATVGNKGTQSLCDINYPEEGYIDHIKVVDNNVYLFVSRQRPLRAELRVLSLKEKEKVTICYHVR